MYSALIGFPGYQQGLILGVRPAKERWRYFGQKLRIGLDNGLAPKRRQTII